MFSIKIELIFVADLIIIMVRSLSLFRWAP